MMDNRHVVACEGFLGGGGSKGAAANVMRPNTSSLCQACCHGYANGKIEWGIQTACIWGKTIQ